MRVQILSDLHLEFYGEHTKRFVAALDPEDIDVLVLAGDICTEREMVDALGMLCRRYESSDVVYVRGNHEFYGSNLGAINARTKEALKQNKNLHLLDCSDEVIRGQRFIGATLWFADDFGNERAERFMNDFSTIKGFKEWVYDENARATVFFERNIEKDDIVVTHHLPTNLSVAARFARSDLNRFFVCDMEKLIRSRGPKLWVHGHTHDSFDYTIPHDLEKTSTRVVCNPHGYWPMEMNPGFVMDKVIDV